MRSSRSSRGLPGGGEIQKCKESHSTVANLLGRGYKYHNFRKNPTLKDMNTRRGFSIIEVILIVVVLGTVASVGIGVYGSLKKESANEKIVQDVLALNKALNIYRTFGGSLDDITDPQTAINKLKTTATTEQQETVVGLSQSMIDSRLEVVTSDSVEDGYWWARYNSTSKQFEVVKTAPSSGDKIVTGFNLNEALAAESLTEEVRDQSMKFAKNDTWVWDYREEEFVAPEGPAKVPVATGPTTPTPPTNPPTSGTLAQPTFSVVPGSYALTAYDLPLTLVNPNVVGSSQLFYALGAGDFQQYSGSFTVPAGTEVFAYAKSVDPDKFSNSDVASGTYNANAVELEIAFNNSATSFNYAEAGGPLMAGDYSNTPQGSASIILTNGALIPDKYENDSSFVIYYTTDGTDPLSSPTRVQGDPFSNGFPGQSFGISHTYWGNANTAALKAVAVAVNTDIVSTSVVQSATLDIDRTTLREPIVERLGNTVGISYETNFGDMPTDARIYYTTDGTDPGDNDGEPVTGKLYDGSLIDIAADDVVVARVYPPTNYKQWFDTSARGDVTSVAPTVDYFAVDGTSRNIYQIDPTIGNTVVLTDQSIFVPITLAQNPTDKVLYYFEAVEANWRLARYDIDGDSHADMGSPVTGSYEYIPSLRPNNLGFYNGGLYYIARNTDDLVRIDVQEGKIARQSKVADIANNANLGDVGDIAIDPEGILYIPMGNQFATYNIKTLSGYEVKQFSTGESVDALVYAQDGQLYGVSASEPIAVQKVNPEAVVAFEMGMSPYAGMAQIPLFLNRSLDSFTRSHDKDKDNNLNDNDNGVGNDLKDGAEFLTRVLEYLFGNKKDDPAAFLSSPVPTTPAITITDFAGRHPNVDPNAPPPHYAITGSDAKIYAFDPKTGVNTVLTELAPFVPDSLALDVSTDVLYYVAADQKIAKYNINADVHTELGTLAQNGLEYAPTQRISHLAAYCGKLYYIAAGTDDLIEITPGNASITAQRKVADITGDAEDFGTVGDLAIDPNGIAYISGSNGKFASFSMNTYSGYQLISNSAVWFNALLFSEDGVLYGAQNNAPSSLFTVNTNNAGMVLQATSSPVIEFRDFSGRHKCTRSDDFAIVDDFSTTDEDTAISIPVLNNDSAGPNLTLKITEMETVEVTPGTPIALPSGATITLLKDSTIFYDPNGKFEALAAGKTSSDSFTYTATNGTDTDSATVTIQIAGVGDDACNLAFLSQGNPTQLYSIEINSQTGEATYVPIGDPYEGKYNSLAMRDSNKMLYAQSKTNQNFLRIDPSTGEVIDLGPLPGFNITGVAADFNSADDHYYFKQGAKGLNLLKINMDSYEIVETITISEAASMSDITFNSGDGLFYGVMKIGADTGVLASINPADGQVTKVNGGASVISPRRFGAMFSDTAGNVFGVENSGGIYKFNTTTGAATLLGNAPATSTNDGASCHNGIFQLVKPKIDLDADDSSGATGRNYVTQSVNGTGIGITDTDLAIHDFDSPNLESAVVVLRNALPGDNLTIDSLAGGITATAGVSPGQILVTLTGTASIADYKTTLKSMKWTSSIGTESKPRTIEITVSDGTNTSDPGICTVHISSAPPYIINGTSSGVFTNVEGSSVPNIYGYSLVTNILSGQSNSLFNWGDPAVPIATIPNSMQFTNSGFNNVNGSERFLLGSIDYTNSTVWVGSSATGVTMNVTLNFAEHGAKTFSYHLDLVSTTNTSANTAEQNADFVYFNSVFSESAISLGGYNYKLRIEFGETTSQGFSTIDRFHVIEGGSARGFLYGVLIPVEPEPPVIEFAAAEASSSLEASSGDFAELSADTVEAVVVKSTSEPAFSAVEIESVERNETVWNQTLEALSVKQ